MRKQTLTCYNIVLKFRNLIEMNGFYHNKASEAYFEACMISVTLTLLTLRRKLYVFLAFLQ